MQEKTGNPLLKYGIIAIVGILVIVLIAYFVSGSATAMKMVKNMTTMLMFAAILFAIIALVVWLFAKKKKDMLSVRNDEILKACKEQKVPYHQELWMFGDDYASTRKVGDIIGFCMQESSPEQKVVKSKDGKTEHLEAIPSSVKKMVFIAFKSNLIPGKKPKIFSGVEDDLKGGFKALSSPRIYLTGTTFSPCLYDTYMLNRHWGNTTLTDKTPADNVFRYTLQENLRETKSFIDYAINLDAEHVKKKEESVVDNIPLNR